MALGTFGKVLFSTKLNLLYLPYSTAQRYCLLHLIKQNCLPKTSLRKLILMTQASLYQASLYLFSVIPNMVKKVITNLDSSKSSSPNYLPVIVLKNWAWTYYTIAELFNMCLKESYFPYCWFLYFRMLGKGVQLNITALLVSFVVIKIFQKLVNNRLVDPLKKFDLFVIFIVVLGLFDQLQIFWQLHLIELLGLLKVWRYSICNTWYI